MAEQFAKRGWTALALAYWNRPGLPAAFERIPIEPVQMAALRLRQEGYEKIGLWGFSKGAELALLGGSLLPELISCVVAISPINVCCQGISKVRGPRLLDCSSWSFQGKELPYAPLRLDKKQIIRDSLAAHGVCMRSCYEEAQAHPLDSSRIQVENIRGPILFLSAQNDGMWPAAEAAEAMMERLERASFPYPYQHESYAYASHFLIPYRLNFARIFAVERRHPEACMESNLASFEQTLAFLERW